MNATAPLAEAKLAATDLVQKGIDYGLTLAMAIAILIVGYMLASWAAKTVRAQLDSYGQFDATLKPVIGQLVRYGVLILTLITVLAQFGIETTSIIAVLGAAGLAIGLALQGTLQNVASGIMLLVLRPFQVNDFIEAGGISGTVDEIGLFQTRIHTPQNIFMAVPNNKIWSETIINYSRLPTRRLDLVVGISYDDDIEAAKKVLMALIRGEERILKSPEPQILVKQLGASSVDLEIRVWTMRQNAVILASDLRRDMKEALEMAGLSIPYPHQRLILTHENANHENANKA